MDNEKVRLQKFLAQCGIASRRKSEEMIAQGLVKINGRVATIGDKVSPKHDKVTCKGKRVSNVERHSYIALYKPRGYVSAASDDRGNKCVTQLVSDIKKRLYPVGRLDKNSEGLLLMTNDGDFANAIMHPSEHVPKTYRVTVDGMVSEQQLDILNSEMIIDGKKIIPATVTVIEIGKERTFLQFVLYQGINRQIRKMCEEANLHIKRLKRISIGDIQLGNLTSGKYRFLTQDEISKIMKG